MSHYGSIEAGGTKFVCAIGAAVGFAGSTAVGNSDDSTIRNEKFEIIERVSFPTTTPEETMAHVFNFFDQYELLAIGIGSFGPIDVNPASATYGYITTTPKPHWGNFDFLGAVKQRYPIPIGFTTDVNAAALGEQIQGAAQGTNSCVYLTVGTGIGGGAVVNGELLSGFSHPEMGHIILRPHPEETYEGCCPYHSNCLEGLASGPAIEQRFDAKAETLEPNHLAWQLEAHYLAQALMNYILILSPEKIILGGGVMAQKHLFPMVHKELQALLNGYGAIPDVESFIVAPGLGDNSATIGCFILAYQTLVA